MLIPADDAPIRILLLFTLLYKLPVVSLGLSGRFCLFLDFFHTFTFLTKSVKSSRSGNKGFNLQKNNTLRIPSLSVHRSQDYNSQYRTYFAVNWRPEENLLWVVGFKLLANKSLWGVNCVLHVKIKKKTFSRTKLFFFFF